jgi:hypothetical protein
MKVRTDLFTELINSVAHRGAQLIHDLNELDRDFREIASIKASLESRVHDYAPRAGRPWLKETNRREDNSDPKEHLALLRNHLRYATTDFDKAVELLRQKREALAALSK